MSSVVSVDVNKDSKQQKVISYEYNDLNGCKLLILFYITCNVALYIEN